MFQHRDIAAALACMPMPILVPYPNNEPTLAVRHTLFENDDELWSDLSVRAATSPSPHNSTQLNVETNIKAQKFTSQ